MMNDERILSLNMSSNLSPCTLNLSPFFARAQIFALVLSPMLTPYFGWLKGF